MNSTIEKQEKTQIKLSDFDFAVIKDVLESSHIERKKINERKQFFYRRVNEITSGKNIVITNSSTISLNLK